MTIEEKLLRDYNSLSKSIQEKVKFGLQWVLMKLERDESTCKDCIYCYVPIHKDGHGDDDAYCVYLETDCKLGNSCSWMEVFNGNKQRKKV